MDTRNVATEDRAQINDGFQQLNQSMHHSLQALDQKVSEQVEDTNRMLRDFANINSYCATYSQQRIQEMLATNLQQPRKDYKIDTELMSFRNFGLQEPLNS